MIDSRPGPTLALTFTLLSALAVGPGCKAKADAAVLAPVPRVRVEQVEVRERPMPLSLALTGTLRGQRQADIAANAMGRVLQTFVERGAEVKQGDLLATLDTRAASLTAQEASAMAELARSQQQTAKRECERYETLFAQGAIGRAEFDRISDQCKNSPLSVVAAQARAAAASQVVGDGQIRAPFAGVVTDRWAEAGQYVRADSRVVSLVSIDVLRLELTVPEASITRVSTGGALTFEVPAYPGRSFSGTVRFVGAAVREATRDLVAEAEVPNPDRALRPGMFAAVSLAAGEAPATVVPKGALLHKEGSLRVFAVVDQRLEERVVQRGVEKDGLVAVLRGLKPGDKVVAAPTDALLNGQPVE
jgi:RND family efflux transporter MFP subunit